MNQREYAALRFLTLCAWKGKDLPVELDSYQLSSTTYAEDASVAVRAYVLEGTLYLWADVESQDEDTFGESALESCDLLATAEWCMYPTFLPTITAVACVTKRGGGDWAVSFIEDVSQIQLLEGTEEEWARIRLSFPGYAMGGLPVGAAPILPKLKETLLKWNPNAYKPGVLLGEKHE